MNILSGVRKSFLYCAFALSGLVPGCVTPAPASTNIVNIGFGTGLQGFQQGVMRNIRALDAEIESFKPYYGEAATNIVLSAKLDKDGSSAMSGDLNMGTYSVTNTHAIVFKNSGESASSATLTFNGSAVNIDDDDGDHVMLQPQYNYEPTQPAGFLGVWGTGTWGPVAATNFFKAVVGVALAGSLDFAGFDVVGAGTVYVTNGLALSDLGGGGTATLTYTEPVLHLDTSGGVHLSLSPNHDDNGFASEGDLIEVDGSGTGWRPVLGGLTTNMQVLLPGGLLTSTLNFTNGLLKSVTSP